MAEDGKQDYGKHVEEEDDGDRISDFLAFGSSSTGATAAMAEAPQMVVPMPIRAAHAPIHAQLAPHQQRKGDPQCQRHRQQRQRLRPGRRHVAQIERGAQQNDARPQRVATHLLGAQRRGQAARGRDVRQDHADQDGNDGRADQRGPLPGQHRQQGDDEAEQRPAKQQPAAPRRWWQRRRAERCRCYRLRHDGGGRRGADVHLRNSQAIGQQAYHCPSPSAKGCSARIGAEPMGRCATVTRYWLLSRTGKRFVLRASIGIMGEAL